MDFLVIDDDKSFRDAACMMIEDAGHHAEGASTGQAAHMRLKEDNFDAALLDLNLGSEDGLSVLSKIMEAHPKLPVVMVTAAGSVKTAVEAMRRGAVDYLEKPFTREQFLTVFARLSRIQQLGRRIDALEEEMRESRARTPTPLFDFETPTMRGVMEILTRAASTPASVLILGESGTGKSVAARALHEKSHLADKPFVTVSCPSLSRELLESELFGHVKGAFTGAVKDHWGKVRAADGGTLFLDEIGETDVAFQAKLLRALQEGEIRRVGESKPIQVNVRVVAATNQDLAQAIAEKRFREDLFYRLNGASLRLPPLRERADKGYLIRRIFDELNRQRDGRARLRGDAMSALLAYPWPGNIRELHNALRYALATCEGDEVVVGDLPEECLHGQLAHPGARRPALHADEAPGGAPSTAGAPRPPQQDLLYRALCRHHWNVSAVARELGLSRPTIYRRMKRLGLVPPNQQPPNLQSPNQQPPG